ncbi:hypothetical protein M9H77_28851 [Catharanthus roseus]|uniref:Uncharacterized protein n=1 Tax=Catharanthus roseus TaxID=4058 RepID=A0ACC0AGJ5_CATRO|nr:hypothetical protein M9H77_28851 [Catharanthus roseus]
MGRGRVELKRIENKINRQVTFAKRRNGLLKKAYELSVLCDAEVALIIFSNRGKLYEFCSGSSMTETLERYQRCTYGSIDADLPANESQSTYHDYVRLKARVEVLQQHHRNLLGEDLVNLNTKELEHLEHQLETSLKQVRSTKTKCMLDQLSDLQQKEQMLAEDNKILRRKLDQSLADIHLRLTWEGGEQVPQCDNRLPPHSQGFFQPLGLNSNLQMGYNQDGSNGMMNGNMTPNHNVNGFVPGLML